jgi:hypothetical protein
MEAEKLLREYLGALMNPMGFIDEVKGVAEDVNSIQRKKERIIKELLRPTSEYGDQSAIEGALMAGSPGYRLTEEEMHQRMRDRYSQTPEGAALERRLREMKTKYGGMRGV